MNEKKSIDRLFQEKFKDFEVSPPEFVWQNLEAELTEKKKKRRIIPLWFRLSGVAAILIIGFFIAMPFMQDDGKNANPVVLETKEMNPDGSPRIAPTDNPVMQSQSVETVIASEETTEKAKKVMDKHEAAPKTSNEGVAYSQPNEIKGANVDGTNTNKNRIRTPQRKQNNAITLQNEAIVQNNTNANGRNTINRNLDTENSVERNNDTPAAILKQDIGLKSNESIAAADRTNEANGQKGDKVASQNNVVVKPGDITIPQINRNETIAHTSTSIDTATTILPQNELEKMYQEKLKGKEEEKAIAEAGDKNKWNIKPQMAPLFFNTAAEGSPVDADLAANSKDFDNDLSYGVGINYALTDKITIRTGVNTVNMKYATNNVEYYAELNSSDVAGFTSAAVTPSGPGANLIIGTPEPSASAAGTELSTESFEGSLVQKIGFVEVPLEMSYKLISKRFGIDIIGGVSTLFLNDNNVSLISEEGYRSNMGEARNLNNISFSTNVGIGFKYRIFDSFEASFEPMFKYQINTFSGDVGGFKPYFIGLYSGVSFSF